MKIHPVQGSDTLFSPNHVNPLILLIILSLIIFSTLVDYTVGRKLRTEENQRRRKVLLWTRIVIGGSQCNPAYLYGSYLSDTAREDSDIDVMLVTEYEDDYLSGKIWSLTRKVNSKIEPYLVDRNRFINNVNSPLIDLVKKSGLEIA